MTDYGKLYSTGVRLATAFYTGEVGGDTGPAASTLRSDGIALVMNLASAQGFKDTPNWSTHHLKLAKKNLASIALGVAFLQKRKFLSEDTIDELTLQIQTMTPELEALIQEVGRNENDPIHSSHI